MAAIREPFANPVTKLDDLVVTDKTMARRVWKEVLIKEVDQHRLIDNKTSR